MACGNELHHPVCRLIAFCEAGSICLGIDLDSCGSLRLVACRQDVFFKNGRSCDVPEIETMIMNNKNDKSVDNENAESRNARKANPIDVHVGMRVRMRRMLLGMSQEKLGELLSLTFQQVQKYEKGINRIGASRLFELSRVLGVPVQYFYDEVPGDVASSVAGGFAEGSSDGYVADVLSSRDGLELNKAFARIEDPKVRRSIVELVRSLANEN